MELVCVLALASSEDHEVPKVSAVTLYKGMAICEKCLHMIALNENRENSRRPIIISAEEYLQDAFNGSGVH